MSISIFTVTHVPFTPPDDPIYIPLQVGHALHKDYGYQGDDTGDHISVKNPYYSELTGLYWIWKNYDGADYLGLCHYRRYFLNDRGERMTEADYMKLLSSHDVIIAEPVCGDYSYRTVYARSHDIRNLDMTGEVIRELYPDYYDAFVSVTEDHRCYVGNLFIAPKGLFKAYCEWLFTIFAALEERIDCDAYDDYHKRVFGFLSEQLLYVWISHNRLSCCEAPYSLHQEKAETILLKEKIRDYIRQDDPEGAWRCLNDTLRKRPDLLLQTADFGQELRTIEHILNVCRVEKEAGLPTMLQFSRELSVLTGHFPLLVQILEHIQQDDVSEEELQYLTDCKVSYAGIVYIIQNFPQLSEHPVELLNQLAVIYADARGFLTSLSFLQEALALQETNRTTLSNIAAVLHNMGQPEMAQEYEQFLHTITPQGRFVVFTGSDIPILDYIAKQYANALRDLGHQVLRFDKRQFEKSMTDLFRYQQEGIDGVFVFNNVCFQMKLPSGESLWDSWNVPCYNVLVDHPMYYFDTLDDSPAGGVVVCADRYHTDYVRRFYPSVQRTLFLPTAGECLKPYGELKPWGERSIELLFIGSFKYHHDVVYDAFARQLEQALLSHPAVTFEQTVIDCLAASGQEVSDTELKLLIQQYRFIDVNTTALYRHKLLETLIHAGIPVTVYGHGWETSELFRHPLFIHKGLIAPEDGIRLMEDTKIVLNHMAWFKYGASERIYEAMLQGAVSLTDDSEYLREHFQDSVDIRFFALDRLSELPQLVRSLLSDASLSDRIRENAYRQAAQYHTWTHRVQELLDAGL